jgi:Fic-DOC domain mobile mystery protein B
VTDLFQEPEGATNLSPEERRGLLQTWITHRAELNKAEAQNILAGAAWARRRRGLNPADLLDDEYAKALHKQMFGDVWDWAGKYRDRESNIGVEPHLIATEILTLFNDARYWLEHKTYEPDELAVRLHHRLVYIHPFPNGNGRLTRMLADLLVERLGRKPFAWGRGSLTAVSELRASYMAALKAADDHNIEPLLRFARS